jgi:dihydrofolate reductase
MSKVKVYCFGVSIDGYGAGPEQSLENPLGKGGMSLHEWFFPTETFQTMHGQPSENGEVKGTRGVDNDFAIRSFENMGAWILGRNMFTPYRGDWSKQDWKGWWGDNPPYHTPVYVLTHYPRPPIQMEGGTTFYFVTDGIEDALDLAKKNSGGKDIRIGGGVDTVRQYLKAKLIDEMHIAISPTFLGSGENLFHGINLINLGYECAQFTPSEKAAHLIFRKKEII